MRRKIVAIGLFSLITLPAAPPFLLGQSGTEHRIQPSELVYVGAFRLPNGVDPASWAWGGDAMTYYPDGDPGGPADGYPGSIFGTGHAWEEMVSEISIPVPVISPTKDLNDLNTAGRLQGFRDVKAGLFDGLVEIIRVGMEYLPRQGSQTTDKLHFGWGQHFQEPGSPSYTPSHMWCELDLSDPQAAGAWYIGHHSLYSVNDYLFEIPAEWAATHAPGMLLATGRYRDGGWSGQGPSLYAYGPWMDGVPPAPGTRLGSTVLLHYDDSYIPGGFTMVDYQHSDEWTGGTWLTAGDRSAVIFIGTEGFGDCWYGYPDDPDNPDYGRGWWSTSFQGQIIFYDTEELAAVADGTMEPYEPQPYATLNIDEHLYHLVMSQQKHHVNAVCFDRASKLLYVFEPLTDEDKPIVHAWRVGCGDEDGDGYADEACGGDDCDDSDPGVNPGAAEICSGGEDEDCDGLADLEDPDCAAAEFTCELDGFYYAGMLRLIFTLGTPDQAEWASTLILTYPGFAVVPLWTLSLPAIDPPVEVPIILPFPAVGWIGLYTGLFTAGELRDADIEWVYTGSD